MKINLGSVQTAILKPNYIRSNLTAGILHIGVGNFHRAHTFLGTCI